MGFEEISIVSDEFGCAFVASVNKEFGRAYQCRNVDRERGWRIAARFLPPLLRGDRTFSDEEPTGATNHDVTIEVSQRPDSPTARVAQTISTVLHCAGLAGGVTQSPRVCFVFVREQEFDAALVQLGIVRSGRQRKPLGCPLPLPAESLPRLLGRNTPRLRQRAECVVLGSAKRQGNREFATIGKIEAACQSDIAVKGGVVL